MNPLTRIGSAVAVTGAALAALAGVAGPAGAATKPASFSGGASNALFVQTDNLTGNQVVAYQRAANGTLTLAGTYNTGGLGGQLTGSAVDHTASQGSLTYANGALYAVNAGSDTVSVFAAHGDQLSLLQTIKSGGAFPVSVAVHGGLVYVLNALRGGSVQGFRLASDHHLFPIPGSHRRLNLNEGATPQFTHTPGQVAFSPSGSQLIVTTKANRDDIDVFGVGALGELSKSPVVNSEPSEVPFGVTFDSAGHLVVAESAANSAVATFALQRDGKVTQLDQALTGQAATCWITGDGDQVFADNAGSASVTGLGVSASGQLSLIGQTSTDPGTVDGTISPDGSYLYVQTGGNGIVDEYSISGGSLTQIGSVTVANAAGGEGIAAA
jgi:6-phosphogluconolactonase (cycloisomerase 2 family)